MVIFHSFLYVYQAGYLGISDQSAAISWRPAMVDCARFILDWPKPGDVESTPKSWSTDGCRGVKNAMIEWTGKKGNIFTGNQSYFPMKFMGLSCNLSLKPIHWMLYNYLSICESIYLIILTIINIYLYLHLSIWLCQSISPSLYTTVCLPIFAIEYIYAVSSLSIYSKEMKHISIYHSITILSALV